MIWRNVSDTVCCDVCFPKIDLHNFYFQTGLISIFSVDALNFCSSQSEVGHVGSRAWRRMEAEPQ